jgi:ketosteroid isomerase-like protein
MSDDAMPIALAVMDGWNRRDYPAVLAHFDEGVEFELAIGSPIDGHYHGLDETRKAVGEFWNRFGDFHTEVTETAVNGNQVVLGTRNFGRGRRSNVEVEMTNWQVYTVDDGRIVGYLICATKDEALEAAVLSE